MNSPMEAVNTPIPQPGMRSGVTITEFRRFCWAVQCELWEVRSLYIAPAVAGAIVLLATVVGHVHLSLSTGPGSSHEALEAQGLAAALVMATSFLVGIFYCLEALHGERKDRSILFWKSLPVSDLTTVLAKAAIPILVLPAITFAVTVVTQALMLLFGSVNLLAHGMNVGPYWSLAAPVPTWVMLFLHLVTVHILWYAPIYGWLLMVSAWARRVPFLWAVLPVLGLIVVEKIAFDTSRFASLLAIRFSGGPGSSFELGSRPMHAMSHMQLGPFFASPGLWFGLIFTAAFLAIAIKLRQQRGPI